MIKKISAKTLPYVCFCYIFSFVLPQLVNTCIINSFFNIRYLNLIHVYCCYSYCYSASREMELTHEQLRIVKFDPKEGEFAKIVAFAGNYPPWKRRDIGLSLSVCPSICLSVCLSVRLSVCPAWDRVLCARELGMKELS